MGGLKGKQQLITLKKLLKTNQSKQFDIQEYPDRKLPFGWKKKVINGVEYFKDPTEKFVFNSRKLVVEHLRSTNYDLSDEDLVSIMEDSDSESDLSDTESEQSDEEQEVNKKPK